MWKQTFLSIIPVTKLYRRRNNVHSIFSENSGSIVDIDCRDEALFAEDYVIFHFNDEAHYFIIKSVIPYDKLDEFGIDDMTETLIEIGESKINNPFPITDSLSH